MVAVASMYRNPFPIDTLRMRTCQQPVSVQLSNSNGPLSTLLLFTFFTILMDCCWNASNWLEIPLSMLRNRPGREKELLYRG